MTSTKQLIATILEDVQSNLKLVSLKLEANLNEGTIKSTFIDQIKALDESDIDFKEVVTALEADTALDETFTSIKTILAGIESLEEENSNKIITSLIGGVSLVAENINSDLDSRILEAVQEKEGDIEAKVSALYEDATKEWAEKREAELNESNLSEEEMSALHDAKGFVLKMNEALTEHGIVFDLDANEEIESLKEQVSELQEAKDKFELVEKNRTKEEIFESVFGDLTEFEKEKFKSVSEHTIFITEKDYKEKLENMKKSFAKSKKPATDKETDEDDKEMDDKKYKKPNSKGKQSLSEEVSRLYQG